jgi:hypothetical protein
VTAVVIMASVLGVLVVGFVAFYLHSRTPEWGESELRRSVLRMLVVIAPLWGMRYREPHHEVPVVTTPGEEPDRLPTTAAPLPAAAPPPPRAR